MPLIDSTYFIFDVNTPETKYSSIQDYVNRYEPEILKKLLGLDLYRKVIDLNNTDIEIVELRDGVDYTVDGVLYRWNGLRNDEKISLISYYIYYWYVRLNLSETSTTGEVQIDLENGSIANTSLKLQDVWGKLQKLYGSECEPENYESCYAFLNMFKEDYPTWQFEEIGDVNILDL